MFGKYEGQNSVMAPMAPFCSGGSIAVRPLQFGSVWPWFERVLGSLSCHHLLTYN